MYQVLARKWRPRSFDDLVGQDHVARTLANAIASGRLAHAYLFSGLRGTGKTSVARILAKCLNCATGPTRKPCDACTPCVEIAEGRSLDVLEIDAASRTQVDKTRELLDTLAYPPVRDRRKIVIIDEVHMLSRHSFNALLKTLEEPPPYVTFVLATTEIHKILPTILSRCQVFEFRRVTASELAAHLRHVCDVEGVTISDASIDRIARAGEGSVRDALSVLERVLAFCGATVEDDDVLHALGAVRTEVLVETVAALAARDVAALLRLLDGLLDEGRDLLHFWSELIAVLRDLLLLRALPERLDLVSRPTEDARRLAAASEGLSQEDLTRIFRLFAELEPGLKSSAQPRFLFEAALIRVGSLGAVRPIEEFLASLTGDGPSTPPLPGGSAPAGGGGRREPDLGTSSASRPRGAVASGDPGFRRAFEGAVQRAKGMLGGILTHASAIEVDGGTLRVVFPAAEGAFLAQADREDYRDVLRQCAVEILGRAVDVRVEAAPDAAAAPTAPEVAGDDRDRRPAAGNGRADGHRRLVDLARSEPGVNRLLREFGAQVLDIRPLEAPVGDPSDGVSGGALEETT